MKKENLNKLKEIFSNVLDIDGCGSPEEVHSRSFDDVRKVTMDKWDSVADVTLVTGIESVFDILLSFADYERMTSFKGVELLLTEKGL